MFDIKVEQDPTFSKLILHVIAALLQRYSSLIAALYQRYISVIAAL